jgi:hypothetical protein
MSEWTAILVSNSILLAALSVAVLFARNYVREWIVGTVRHDFERKLETLRADFRSKEEHTKATREGPLSSAAAAQAIIMERRLKAVDELWVAVNDWHAFRINATVVGMLNFEVASQQVATQPGLQKMMKSFEVSLEKLQKVNKADAAQPYLSDILWALYLAYMSIFFSAILKANALATGLDARPFLDEKRLNEMLIQALPDWKQFIIDHGHKAPHLLIDTLRQRMLQEVRRIISGREDDNESVARAAAIVNAVNGLQEGWSSAETALKKTVP